MANPFAHIELTTSDLDRAKKFYKKLFDWKLDDVKMDGPVYTMIAPGSGATGGMQAQPMPSAPIQWLPYVEVDDVTTSLEKAEKAGAKVVQPTMDVGTNGTIGIFVDPAGAMLGIWAQAKPAKKSKDKKSKDKKSKDKVPEEKPAEEKKKAKTKDKKSKAESGKDAPSKEKSKQKKPKKK